MTGQVWVAIIGGVATVLVALIGVWKLTAAAKSRRQEREREDLRRVIKSARKGLASMGLDHRKILGEKWYEDLRPYLADDVVRTLEHPRTLIVEANPSRGGGRNMLAREIDRIEREQGLRPG